MTDDDDGCGSRDHARIASQTTNEGHVSPTIIVCYRDRYASTTQTSSVTKMELASARVRACCTRPPHVKRFEQKHWATMMTPLKNVSNEYVAGTVTVPDKTANNTRFVIILESYSLPTSIVGACALFDPSKAGRIWNNPQ